MKLALIGCGNMGQALIRGFISRDLLKGGEINLFDTDQEKTAAFARETGAQPAESASVAVSGVDIVLLAVKPQVIENAVASFADHLAENTLLVSIAAGVSLKKLRMMAGPRAALARVMPNTPAMVGCGVSAICFDRASHQQKQQAENLLTSVGLVFPIQEKLMDAVTGLSGSGPAYVMIMIEALADAGVREGLPRDQAIRMAAMTMMGSAKLVLESGVHPAVLKDQVCSPGGTTIEAVASLEENGLRSALIMAVRAASEKSRQMREQADSHG